MANKYNDYEEDIQTIDYESGEHETDSTEVQSPAQSTQETTTTTKEYKPIESNSVNQWWSNIKAKSDLLNGRTPNSWSTGVVTTTPQTTTEETETTTTTTESKPKTYAEVLEEVTKDQNEKNLASLKALQEINTKGLSAYQTLLKDSIKRREELAQKKERNARSQAIANALGSLVNVITAGAIAKRNGSIPIVADYDATADTALRKSIEDRYTLGNENEALLLSLANERRKHEAEIAKQNYAQEVAANAELAKAKLKPYETEEALRLYNAKQAAWADARKDVDVNKGEVQKGVNAAKPQSNNGKNGGKPKPFEYNKDKLKQFATNATSWEKRDYSDPLYVERDEKGAVKYGEDGKPIKYKTVKYSAKPSDVKYIVANQAAKRLQEKGISDAYQTTLAMMYRNLFQDKNYADSITEKIGAGLIDMLITNIERANANKKNLMIGDLTAMAKLYIDKQKKEAK